MARCSSWSEHMHRESRPGALGMLEGVFPSHLSRSRKGSSKGKLHLFVPAPNPLLLLGFGASRSFFIVKTLPKQCFLWLTNKSRTAVKPERKINLLMDGRESGSFQLSAFHASVQRQHTETSQHFPSYPCSFHATSSSRRVPHSRPQAGFSGLSVTRKSRPFHRNSHFPSDRL